MYLLKSNYVSDQVYLSHRVNAPTSAPGLAGPFTGQGGLLAYNEICYKVKNEGWTVVGPTSQMGPYAYKDKQWVSYDDPATIRKKVLISYVYLYQSRWE